MPKQCKQCLFSSGKLKKIDSDYQKCVDNRKYITLRLTLSYQGWPKCKNKTSNFTRIVMYLKQSFEKPNAIWPLEVIEACISKPCKKSSLIAPLNFEM